MLQRLMTIAIAISCSTAFAQKIGSVSTKVTTKDANHVAGGYAVIVATAKNVNNPMFTWSVRRGVDDLNRSDFVVQNGEGGTDTSKIVITMLEEGKYRVKLEVEGDHSRIDGDEVKKFSDFPAKEIDLLIGQQKEAPGKGDVGPTDEKPVDTAELDGLKKEFAEAKRRDTIGERPGAVVKGMEEFSKSVKSSESIDQLIDRFKGDLYKVVRENAITPQGDRIEEDADKAAGRYKVLFANVGGVLRTTKNPTQVRGALDNQIIPAFKAIVGGESPPAGDEATSEEGLGVDVDLACKTLGAILGVKAEELCKDMKDLFGDRIEFAKEEETAAYRRIELFARQLRSQSIESRRAELSVRNYVMGYQTKRGTYRYSKCRDCKD